MPLGTALHRYMPDPMARRQLPPARPLWRLILGHGAEQLVAKHDNQLYAVAHTDAHALHYVPVPLPPGTHIAPVDNDNEHSDTERSDDGGSGS